MNKQQIRDKVLEMRRSLTSKYIEDNSYNIYEKLIDFEVVKKAENILIYSDFDGEVKTANLAGWLLYKGKNVYLPVVNNKKMYGANIKNSKLVLSSFGVPQPEFESAKLIEPNKLDVVIVPGIAFDKGKNRIGYGYGYYDTYLKEAVNATKIGILYEFQLQNVFACEAHDIKMDYLITPEQII